MTRENKPRAGARPEEPTETEAPTPKRGMRGLASAATMAAALMPAGNVELLMPEASASEQLAEDDADRWVPLSNRLKDLATSGDSHTRLRTAEHLSHALEAMTGLESTALIADWATSPSSHVRLTLAHALLYAPPTLGSWSAIEHLSLDPEPSVREAVVGAAWLRRDEAPDRMTAVIGRLLDDPDATVRGVASRTRKS